MEFEHTYRGINFVEGNDSVTPEKIAALVKSAKLREWVDQQVDNGVVKTSSVKVNDIKFFGPVSPERLGFVMIEGDAVEAVSGAKVAATCAFIRGGSVAVFVRAVVTNGDGDIVGDYGVFTDQIRYPVGRRLQEACAGCVDSNTGNIKGVALTELQEELGIVVNADDVTSLGSIVPSGGGTYETIELFYLRVFLTESEVQEKINKTFGVEDEKIHLVFTPIQEMDNYLDVIGDVKAECAWRRIQSRGLL